jgi:hypothetical protein
MSPEDCMKQLLVSLNIDQDSPGRDFQPEAPGAFTSVTAQHSMAGLAAWRPTIESRSSERVE